MESVAEYTIMESVAEYTIMESVAEYTIMESVVEYTIMESVAEYTIMGLIYILSCIKHKSDNFKMEWQVCPRLTPYM
jgi:hypothetical protein